MDFLNPYYLQIVVFALINVVNALSVFFAMSTGQISLGTAGFMSVGAYTSAVLTMQYDVPMFLTIFLSGLIAAIVAVFIGGLTTRLSGLYLTIATIGFSEIIRVLFLNWDFVGGALGLNGIPALGSTLTNSLAAAGVLDTLNVNYAQLGNLVQIILLLLTIFVIVLIWNSLNKSKVGRAFQAVRADEYAAELSGINVAHYKTISFVMSGLIAGIGGAFYAHSFSSINPNDFSFDKSVDNLLYVVFGGSEVVGGPIFGSVFLTIMPEFLRGIADYREMIYGILLLVMMIFRPQGIITKNLMNKFKASKNKGNAAEEESEES